MWISLTSPAAVALPRGSRPRVRAPPPSAWTSPESPGAPLSDVDLAGESGAAALPRGARPRSGAAALPRGARPRVRAPPPCCKEIARVVGRCRTRPSRRHRPSSSADDRRALPNHSGFNGSCCRRSCRARSWNSTRPRAKGGHLLHAWRQPWCASAAEAVRGGEQGIGNGEAWSRWPNAHSEFNRLRHLDRFLPFWYTEQVLSTAEELLVDRPDSDMRNRKDLSTLKVYATDVDEADELDDALSATRLPDGRIKFVFLELCVIRVAILAPKTFRLPNHRRSSMGSAIRCKFFSSNHGGAVDECEGWKSMGLLRVRQLQTVVVHLCSMN